MNIFDASAGAYLLLVSFSTFNADNFSSKVKDTSLVSSPYDGIAIPYVNAYHYHDIAHDDIYAALDNIHDISKKDIWPWIYINRIVGYMQKGSVKKKKEPFKHIKGMDLNNTSGDLSRFYDILDGALKYAASAETGIVIDLEPYNNHRIYNISYLATKMGVSELYVILKLQDIGSYIIRKSHVYNSAMKIWLLFSSLNHKQYYKDRSKTDVRSISYIVLGMLKEIKRLNSNVKIISGGQIGIGYCNINIKHLNNKIKSRDKAYHDLLINNPGLTLGSPLVPWLKKTDTKGWLTKGDCKKSEINTGEEFQPIMETLFNQYDYIWVYSTGHSDYKPFKNNNSIIDRSLLIYK